MKLSDWSRKYLPKLEFFPRESREVRGQHARRIRQLRKELGPARAREHLKQVYQRVEAARQRRQKLASLLALRSSSPQAHQHVRNVVKLIQELRGRQRATPPPQKKAATIAGRKPPVRRSRKKT